MPACVIAISTSRGPIDGIGVFGAHVRPGSAFDFLIASIIDPGADSPSYRTSVRYNRRVRVRFARGRFQYGGTTQTRPFTRKRFHGSRQGAGQQPAVRSRPRAPEA